jgi:hypothetical protein
MRLHDCLGKMEGRRGRSGMVSNSRLERRNGRQSVLVAKSLETSIMKVLFIGARFILCIIVKSSRESGISIAGDSETIKDDFVIED